jgi:aminocarboxymuconate-semialdehyde decarboxylase
VHRHGSPDAVHLTIVDKSMLKIDIHTHFIPHNLPDLEKKFGYPGFVRLEHQNPTCAHMHVRGEGIRKLHSNCWDPATRLSECREHGVDVQVLSPIPILFSYWAKPRDALDLCRFVNDEIATVCRNYPRHFVGLGIVPLQDPDLAIREMERCVSELGLAGVEIGTHVNNWNFYEPALVPFFEAAEKIGAAIFVHPWDMMSSKKMNKYWLPWLVGMPAETSLAICSMIFSGLFDRFPKLRVAFAHGGGSFPATIGRISHAHRVRPDICAVDNPTDPREYIGKFYIDSIVHDGRYFQYLLDLFTADYIALGSDYPFPLGELSPGKLIENHPGLTDAQRQRLLSGTALEWLNLSHNQFK